MTNPIEEKSKENSTETPVEIVPAVVPEKKKRGRKKKVTVLDLLQIQDVKNEENDETKHTEESIKIEDLPQNEEKIEVENLIKEIEEDNRHFLKEDINQESFSEDVNDDISEEIKGEVKELPRKKRKYKKRKSQEKELEKKLKKNKRNKKFENLEKDKVYGLIWNIRSSNPYFEPKPLKSLFQILLWQNVLVNGREERLFLAKYSSMVNKSQVEVDFPGCEVEKLSQGLIENFRNFCSEERNGDISGIGKEIPRFLDKLRDSKGFEWDGEDFTKIKLKTDFTRTKEINSFNPNFSLIKFYFFIGKQDMSLCELVYKIFDENEVYKKSNKSQWLGYFAQKCITFEFFSTLEFLKTMQEIYFSPNFSHIQSVFVFGYEDILGRIERESSLLQENFKFENIKNNIEEIFELDWSDDQMSIEIICRKRVKPEFSLETTLYMFLEEVVVNKSINLSLEQVIGSKKKIKGKKIIAPLNVKDFCTGMLIKLKENGYEIEKAQDIVKGICASKYLDYEIHSDGEEIKRVEDMLYN